MSQQPQSQPQWQLFAWEVELAKRMSEALALVLQGAFLTEEEAIAKVVGDGQSRLSALAIAMLVIAGTSRRKKKLKDRFTAAIQDLLAGDRTELRTKLQGVCTEFQQALELLNQDQVVVRVEDNDLSDMLQIVERSELATPDEQPPL